MKKLVFLLLFGFGCAQEGDHNTYRTAPSCTVKSDAIECGDTVYEMEAPSCAAPTEEEPEPVMEPSEDEDTEVLPAPLAINYHGVVCGHLPVVTINSEIFIIHSDRLNAVASVGWTTIWEKVKKHKTTGCSVRVNGNGQLISRYNK